MNKVIIAIAGAGLLVSACATDEYGNPSEAQAAIGTLDGTSVLGHTLQVKFADADAGGWAGRGQRKQWGAVSDCCACARVPVTESPHVSLPAALALKT